MAKTNGPTVASDAKSASRASAAASRRVAVQATRTLVESPSAAVDAAFKEDDKLRTVLTKHLAEHAKESQDNVKRARAAFEHFKPSMFTSAQRDRRTYLAPGENLPQSMHAVVDKGVAAMRASAAQRTLKIHPGKNLHDLVNRGKIPLQDLVKFLHDKLGDVPTLRNDPARVACDAEAKANEVLRKVEGKDDPAALAAAPAAIEVAAPAADTDGGPARTRDFVRGQVGELMANVAPPEGRLLFGLDTQRAGLADTESNVASFQLRAGASDVISYHDFNVLQIAFEHVWTELFDSRLQDLGAQLYHAYIEQLDFQGWKSDPKRSITSIEDIQDLLRDIRTLSGVADGVGKGTTGFFPIASLLKGSSPFSGIGGPSWATVGNTPLLSTETRDGTAVDGQSEPLFEGARRLSTLMEEMETLLRQKYSFTVFAENSYNFGIMVTYRQTWKPEKYQVGELVSTIPLAPREVRRYTTRHVVKKTRAVKEVEDSLRTTRSESSGTSRVEREIIDKAQQKSDFDVTTHGSFGGEGYQADVTARAGGEQASQSEKAKKHFHEAVLKSAQEYRQQNRMEIDTTASAETEETTFHEIQNPNDELTVTYMFYELQRTYRISERIQQLTPVILVANKMPAPDAIDDAWLISNDWILRRVILDDSFKPALEYLTKSFVGAELNLRILDTNARAQKQVVDKLNQQIQMQTSRLQTDERNLADTVKSYANVQEAQGAVNSIKRIFDPLGITGKEGEGAIAAGETMVDYLQETFDRAEREKARLLEQLGVAATALQAAIDKLSAATREHYDRVAEIDRLRIHVKENILYYMQAIWSHEPPDQRFFRIYNLDVLVVEPEPGGVTVPLTALTPSAVDALNGRTPSGASLPMPPVKVVRKKLVEVADLDTVLGYKGNYAIYALNENNYITLHMMQDYLEVSDTVRLRDPDEFGNYTVDELQKLAQCMYQRDRSGFEKYRKQFKDLIIERLTSGRAEDDLVIVPTTSLYIEALVGTHPLLEDFKLIHRALDVKKVQADVRHAELENIRLAARALKGKDEDPDIEKKVLIETDSKRVAVQADTT